MFNDPLVNSEIVYCYLRKILLNSHIGTKHFDDLHQANMKTIDQLINQFSEEVDKQPQRIVETGFEADLRLQPVNPDLISRSQRRGLIKFKNELSSGAKWFDMPIKDLELKDKLEVDAIRLRQVLDPRKFYKRNSADKISKHFQVGKVIEHPMDFYSARATKKERRQTILDEFIADDEFKAHVKKRYARLGASNAIKKKEKAMADRRKLQQGKKKSRMVKKN